MAVWAARRGYARSRSLQRRAQLSVPRWVQGRALAVYQIAVQGGLAAASVRRGARSASAVRFARGALVRRGVDAGRTSRSIDGAWRLPTIKPNRSGRLCGPHPQIAIDMDPDSGPALIMVEYRIDPREDRGVHRRRCGISAYSAARRRGASGDSSSTATSRSVSSSSSINETWVEHLRQHERSIDSDASSIRPGEII